MHPCSGSRRRAAPGRLSTALVVALFAAHPLPATAATERDALVALYEAAGGDRWVYNRGWLGNDAPCSGGTANWAGLI